MCQGNDNLAPRHRFCEAEVGQCSMGARQVDSCKYHILRISAARFRHRNHQRCGPAVSEPRVSICSEPAGECELLC